MDATLITELIASLGFPIVCVIALGYFIFHIYKRSEDREDALMGEIRENRVTNAKAIETIALYAERLTNIEGNINEIKDDVVLIKEKMNS